MDIQVNNLYLRQNDFSFQIKNWSLNFGEHVLIYGSSGCGKTSFLHLLAGLLKPTRGDIKVGEYKISDLSKNELCAFRRENIGMIFQKIHLLPHLTLRENVFLGLRPPDASNEALKLLKNLGLEDRMEHLPKELSLGETQRASIARGLTSSPNIILADEPTASLDDANAEIVFKLLKEKHNGKTLIIVTHDFRAWSYFDKVFNFKELLSK